MISSEVPHLRFYSSQLIRVLKTFQIDIMKLNFIFNTHWKYESLGFELQYKIFVGVIGFFGGAFESHKHGWSVELILQ